MCWINTFPYTLINQATYCNNQIHLLGFEYEHCGNRACTAKDCFVKECIKKLADDGYQTDPICGNNFEYYDSQEDYCAAKYDLAHQSSPVALDYFTCGVLNHCTSEKLCCLANCNVKYQNAAFPTCDSDFEPYDSITEYCQAYCPERRIDFLSSTCAGPYCNKYECCHTECMLGVYQGFCDHQYNFLTQLQYCDLKCQDPDHDFNSCSVTPCNQDNCRLMQCEDDFVRNNYSFLHVCSDRGVYYLTKTLYCQAYMTNVETGYFNCPNCANQLACCTYDCVQEYTNNYSARCLSNHEFYTTAESYCNAKCASNNTLTDLMCSNFLCSQQQCCVDKCEIANPHLECSASYQFLAEPQFCLAFCQSQPTIACRQNNAQVSCTQALCDTQQCIDSFNIVSSHVCAQGLTLVAVYYYDTKEAYCALTTKPTILTTCLGGNCDSVFNCCKERCMTLFSVNFSGRCLSDFSIEYQATQVDSFCTDYCNARQSGVTLALAQCSGSDCSYAECCIEKCLASNPHHFCTSDWQTMITRQSYCANLCANTPLTTKECNANCSDTECKILGCISNLASTGYVSQNVCGRQDQKTATTLDDLFFFYTTQRSYCEAYIVNTVDGYVLCYGETVSQQNSIACASSVLCNHHKCRIQETERSTLPMCLPGG